MAITGIKFNRMVQEQGFTLVELLIALAVGAMILAAVMTSFQTQHAAYLAQGQVVVMHQNARAAINMLAREIRTAGYDPNDLGAGITAVGANTITFTRDDGTGALETIRFAPTDAYLSVGRNDGVVDDLGREVNGGGLQPLAEDITNIEFRYLDANGNVTATLNDIRSVQIAILGQSAYREVKQAPGQKTYTTPGGVNWVSAPGFWSVFLTTTVKCRNLGL